MNQNTARYFSSVWAIGGPALDSLYAAGASLLAGGSKPGMFEIRAAKQASLPRQAAQKEKNEAKKLIVPIRGTITKYDQECGPIGSDTLRGLLVEADQSGQYSEICFLIDSGGGEADGTGLLADTIAGLKTPTKAIISGMCCSAAYWIASACNSIEATSDTDLIGCIGTMMTMKDMRGKLEKEGVKLTEMFASTSPDKNIEFRAALDGDYSHITTILDAFNASFLAFLSRRNIAAEALTGKTYTAKEAMRLGLIDSITKNAAQATQTSKNSNHKEHLMKSYSKINALVGFALLAVWAEAEGASAALDGLEAHLAQSEKDIEAAKAENVGLLAELEKPGATETTPIALPATSSSKNSAEWEQAKKKVSSYCK